MSASSDSTVNQSSARKDCRSRRSGCRGGGNWSGLNVAAMVIGFIAFWPIGMLLLFWNITGRDVRELPGFLRAAWSRISEGNWSFNLKSEGKASDNTVFNQFQQTQYDRIQEIRDEIKDRSRRFHEFRESARRRADEEEFDRFMKDVPVNGDR